jgi:hypothetical protein
MLVLKPFARSARTVFFFAALGLIQSPALPQASGGGTWASNAPVQRALVPFAIETGPQVYDLWTVDELTGVSLLRMEGLAFQPLELVGYARKDHLRINMPTPGRMADEDDDDDAATIVPDHIRIPGGGALYHNLRGGFGELLMVGARFYPRSVFSLPASGDKSVIQSQVGVSVHGTLALAATVKSAGGDVYLVDLSGIDGPRNLSANLPVLQVEGGSLRVSDSAAWFVADSVLYRAVAPEWVAAPVDLGLLSGEEVLPESVLAVNGRHLAVVVEGSSDQRRVLLSTADGPTQVITPTPADYCTPDLDEPLGPHLAVDPDGELVAYCTIGTSKEVYVKPHDGPPTHLSTLPQFQESLDNVGVLGFGTGFQAGMAGIDNVGVLSFFGGSDQISGLTGQELIGAADMYAAVINSYGEVEVVNVTRTSGQLSPPFDPPGTLTIAEAVLDPLGQRMLLTGETEEDDYYELAVLYLDGGNNWPQPNVQVLLTALEEEPWLHGTGSRVLALVPTDDGPAPSSVYLLQPKSGGAQDFTRVADFPQGAQLSRVASRKGAAVFVARDPNGVEVPHYVDLKQGTSVPATPPGWSLTLSAAVTISNGRLYVGAGANNNQLTFLRFDGPWNFTPLNLPVGLGFPLPH